MNRCRSRRGHAHLSGRCNPPPPPTHGRRSDRGSAAVELVVLAPVLVTVLMFVVFAGRLTQANARVRHAADQAARAASMVSLGRSGGVAAATATTELSSGEIRCSSMSVATSTSDLAGLTAVTVTVECAVDRGDLAPLAPGSHVVRATSTEVLDRYRAVEP